MLAAFLWLCMWPTVTNCSAEEVDKDCRESEEAVSEQDDNATAVSLYFPRE